jgi:hypothetical protein
MLKGLFLFRSSEEVNNLLNINKWYIFIVVFFSKGQSHYSDLYYTKKQ